MKEKDKEKKREIQELRKAYIKKWKNRDRVIGVNKNAKKHSKYQGDMYRKTEGERVGESDKQEKGKRQRARQKSVTGTGKEVEREREA